MYFQIIVLNTKRLTGADLALKKGVAKFKDFL